LVGEIVGIVGAFVFLILLVLILAFFIIRRRKRLTKLHGEDSKQALTTPTLSENPLEMAGVPKESEEEAKSTFYYPPEKPVEKLPPKPVEQPVAIPKDKTLKLPPKPVEKPSEKLPREEGGRDAVVTGAGAVAGNGHMFNHNFFKAKERLTKKEIQGEIRDQAFRFLPTRSNIYSEIVRSKREELLMSKIAFQLHKKEE